MESFYKHNFNEKLNIIFIENWNFDKFYKGKVDKDYKVSYENINLSIMDYRWFAWELANINNIADHPLINKETILIFNGITWDNIICLFNFGEFILHGGSITRRHKLSSTEYLLSKFLYLSGLDGSKNDFYNAYVEKIITNPKLDFKFYNHFKNKINLNTSIKNVKLLNKLEIKGSFLSELIISNFEILMYLNTMRTINNIKEQTKAVEELSSRKEDYYKNYHNGKLERKLKNLADKSASISKEVDRFKLGLDYSYDNYLNLRKEFLD